MLLFEAVADDLDELVEIERLEDRVADRVLRDLVDAALSGGGADDDVRTLVGRIGLSDLLDELIAIHAGHHEVEEDEIEAAVLPHFFQSDGAVLGQLDVELHPLQNGLQQNADGQVIIDDEDMTPRAVEFSYGHHLDPKCINAKHIPS